jgi:16S rRNA (uracil1498-N3)-methyltransferase
MKTHRFIGDYNFDAAQITIADEEVVKQIRSVLRLAVGEQLILCDGRGQEALVTIETVGKNEIILKVEKVMENENEPAKHVVLYCAVLKRENFELVVQKATEIGVKESVPVITKRTVKLNLNLRRLEKIIKEAAEQSGRGVVPVLCEPIDFEKALEQAKDNEVNFFFDVSGEKLKAESYKLKAGVWIGPEGGWDATELEAAKNADMQIATLGKRTLRAETAAIVASYLAVRGEP